MSDETRKDPCPVCAERAKAARTAPPAARTAVDYVFCPVCDGAKCRVTGAGCAGRVIRAVRRDDGAMYEDIGFPCQEPASRVLARRPDPLPVNRSSLPAGDLKLI